MLTYVSIPVQVKDASVYIDWLKYICWLQNNSRLIDLCEVSSCVNSSAYFSVLKMVIESHNTCIKNMANHGNVSE